MCWCYRHHLDRTTYGISQRLSKSAIHRSRRALSEGLSTIVEEIKQRIEFCGLHTCQDITTVRRLHWLVRFQTRSRIVHETWHLTFRPNRPQFPITIWIKPSMIGDFANARHGIRRTTSYTRADRSLRKETHHGSIEIGLTRASLKYLCFPTLELYISRSMHIQSLDLSYVIQLLYTFTREICSNRFEHHQNFETTQWLPFMWKRRVPFLGR